MVAALVCACIALLSPGMDAYAAVGIIRSGRAAVPGISAAASAVGTIGAGHSANGVPAVPSGLQPSLPGLGNASISLPSIPAIAQARPEWSLPQPSFAAGLMPAQAALPSISAIPDAAAPKAADSDLSAVFQPKSAAPSSTLADRVNAVLGRTEAAWQYSFSAQPADPESAAPSDEVRPTAPISQDRAFQYWVKKFRHPHAALAVKLAERMSWDQVLLLSNQGGFQFLPGKQGCEHACLGCLVRAGERRPIKQTTWEEYTERIRALAGLEAALKAIQGEELRLFSGTSVMPFYDSEPMSVLFPAKDGPPKTILDMARFLHETTGKASQIVSSGWNPRSRLTEGAAAAMARDAAAGKAPYLDRAPDGTRMTFQIKPVSKRFMDEAEAFITPLLRADAGFWGTYGKEFEKFGFDFKQYSTDYEKANSAYWMYHAITQKNMKAFVDSSAYIADRMENLKTLAPAIRAGQVQLASYYLGDGFSIWSPKYSPEVAFVMPWMDYGDDRGAEVLLKLLEERFARTYGKDLIPKWDWVVRRWMLRSGAPGGEGNGLGTPVLLHNGAIGFSGASKDYLTSRLPNMAASKDSMVRGLADTPVLSLDGRKAPWQAAADRLDGTRHLDLTEAVRQSVAERIKQASEGSLSPRLRDVSRRAVLKKAQGKRPEAWLKVRDGARVHWFRFKDGRVYEQADPLRGERR
jgi:hypothetical protein